MKFYTEREMGYCGLACVLCSDENCVGCKAKSANGDFCSVSKCAMQKGLDGCYACPEYQTCGEGMLQGKRNRAFNRYANEFGKQALIERLRRNYETGVTYHRPDGLTGDYDALETEDEIYNLLRYGRNDPYANCPEFDTEHFHLRQVRMQDAEDLLCFYGDLSEWMFYGNSWSNGIFTSIHPTLEEMQKCISSWLDEYKNRYYIRFSVIDKATEKAIGTIEVFDNAGKGDSCLHIDLSAPYENQLYISELLTLADKEFFGIFSIKNLFIQASPTAKERITALHSAGFEAFHWDSPGREHYYIKTAPQ